MMMMKNLPSHQYCPPTIDFPQPIDHSEEPFWENEDHGGVLLPVELFRGIRGKVNSPLHRREDGLHPRIP